MLARSVQCYMLCGVRIFQQAMRNVLTNVLVMMSADFPISTSEKGSLLAAIPLGYFITQVPGGALADKVGAKAVMLGALCLSACCCLILPTAFEQLGVYGLLGTLTLMGAVQGPMFPTSSVLLARWMPKSKPGEPDEKAWGTSMLDIGISVGTLAIIPTTTFLAESVGWRHTFHVVGLASLAFCIVFGVLAASSPSECWYITDDEKRHLDANVQRPPAPPTPPGSPTSVATPTRAHEAYPVATASSRSPAMPASSLCQRITGLPLNVAAHPGLWAVFFAHMSFNFGAYYLTNWSPTYYKDVLAMPPTSAYVHLMIPHLTNLAAKSLNPMIVGALARRGYSLLESRKAFTFTGFALAAAVLLPAPLVRGYNPWATTVLFSLANAFFGLAPSGFKANYLDITEEYVGLVAGYGNTLGTVASFVQPKLLARILDATGATAVSTATGSWTLVLATVATSNLLAASFYLRCATVAPIERVAVGKTKGA